jgi:hypothetical protein
MLNHPTLDKLKTLKFYGMIQGLQDQAQHPAINGVRFLIIGTPSKPVVV